MFTDSKVSLYWIKGLELLVLHGHKRMSEIPATKTFTR